MTALAPFYIAPAANHDPLAAYTDQTSRNPLLGYIVVYSVFRGQITLADATAQFQDLRLNTDLLPGPLRPDDAFLRVTGADGIRDTYRLDTLRDDGTDAPVTDAPSPAGPVRSASLMIRPVRRDSQRIVRHIVRELRDESASTLAYDTHLGEVVFERDSASSRSGQMVIRLDHAAIATELAPAEQQRVHALVRAVQEQHRWQCQYLGADRIRTLLRDYMHRIDAVPVRPTGGVYFVTADHEATLEGLHQFIEGIGHHSMFARIPLPDETEMRQLIITSFIASSKDALQKLSADIAAAQRTTVTDNKRKALFDRFRTLKHQAADYSQRLETGLGDTSSSLDLVETQLTALLQSQ